MGNESGTTAASDEGVAGSLYDVELTIGGRSQPRWTNPADVIKVTLLALVSLVLGGPDKLTPSGVVRVRNQRSGAVVLYHHWRWDSKAASRAHEAIAAAVPTMSVKEFEAEYGIDSE